MSAVSSPQRVLPKPDFSIFGTPLSDDEDLLPVASESASTVEMNQDYFAVVPPFPNHTNPFSIETTTAAKTNSLFSPKKPQPQSTFETPEKVKTLKRVVREYDFENDGEPYGTSKKQIAEGIKALNTDLTDTPNKKQKSTQSRIVGRLFAEEVVGQDPVSDPVAYHTKAYEIAKASPTLKRLFGAIVQADRTAQHKALSLPIPIEIINIKHLIEADKRGFHLCLPDDPMYQQLSDFRHSYNTVFQANFPVNSSGKTKFSTFFPLHGVDELVNVIQSAEPIATIGNRFLCHVPDQLFLIEMYKSDGVIKSAFPIFFYKVWNPESLGYPIVCGKRLVAPNELLDKAKLALLEYSKPSLNSNRSNPIRYTIESNLIIDLAPSLPDLGVSQGIFMEFPRSLFQGLIDADILDAICQEA
ncbi:MAG: hypothetical protein JSR93_09905 [Verrucomicrobia bacterium]|nr:hypothetical protein [Verrucomicrobiota bacterium]